MSLSPLTLSAALMLAALIAGPAATLAYADDARAKRFVEQYEATVRPLEIEAARRFWTANVTGKEEDFRRNRRPKRSSTLPLRSRAICRVEGD